jgi:hypothetical protein
MLGLWHGIAGLGWPIRRNAWPDTRRAFRSILALFHHLLSDVLAYWRWYGERAADTALPEIYQQFVQKIASSKVLQRLCSDQLHELKWRHALREQLGAMWEQIRYPQRTIKKLAKARPAHFAGDFTFYMCVLCSSHNSAASTTCPPWPARVWSAPSSNGWRT